jgi:hypothetical protein
VRRRPLVRANEDSAMTAAAIADHGLGPQEGDVRGPSSLNPLRTACRGRRAEAPTSRRSSSSTEAACWIRRCCGCRASGSSRPTTRCGSPPLAAMDGQLISDSLVCRYDAPRPPTDCRAPRAPSRSARSSTSTHLPGRADGEDAARVRKMLTHTNHVALYSEEITLGGVQVATSRRRSPTSPS